MKNMFSKNNGKSIEEIMTEVKNISVEQLTATTSADEPVTAPAAVPNPPSDNSNLENELKNAIWDNAEGRRSGFICSKELPFCCKVSIPDGLVKGGGAYDFEQALTVVSNLYWYIDPVGDNKQIKFDDCCEVNVTLYPVKVIGCIHFNVYAYPFTGKCGIYGKRSVANPTPLIPIGNSQDSKIANSTSICCQDAICVNNIVRYLDNIDEYKCTGNAACIKEINELDCSQIKVVYDEVKIEDCSRRNGTQLVVFSGKFILPDLPDATCPPPDLP